MKGSPQDLRALLADEDLDALAAAAATSPRRVLRYLVGRLCSADDAEKWRAVRGIGRLTSDRTLLSDSQTEELLRRFLWALNDESGAVPFGVPEAMAEVLACRPELAPRYLPVLGSCIDTEDLGQWGVIERGVIWGLGRLGRTVLEHAPHAVEALRRTAAKHQEEETRRAATEALRAIVGPAST
jgi:hypothetical protein